MENRDDLSLVDRAKLCDVIVQSGIWKCLNR